jgi:hypothetical protein
MGYLANEKVEGSGLVDVFRLEGDIPDEVAGVIEGHEDHGEAADEVDGGYPLIASVGTLEGGVWNGGLPLRLRFAGILTPPWGFLLILCFQLLRG